MTEQARLTGSGQSRRTARRSTRRGLVGNWVVMPLLILLFSGAYLALFSPLIAWMAGDGARGTFVARYLDCQKGCAWYGDFTSSSRRVVLQDVRFANLNDVPGIKKGTAVPVTDISSVLYHGVAYPRDASPRDFLAPPVLVVLLLGLVPVVLLLSWIWTVPFRYWRVKAAAATAG
jgi:hypothetical protein